MLIKADQKYSTQRSIAAGYHIDMEFAHICRDLFLIMFLYH